jgi:hypothetical protein
MIKLKGRSDILVHWVTQFSRLWEQKNYLRGGMIWLKIFEMALCVVQN